MHKLAGASVVCVCVERTSIVAVWQLFRACRQKGRKKGDTCKSRHDIDRIKVREILYRHEVFFVFGKIIG